MKKKKTSPLIWLLLIPCQLLAGILFVRLGSLIDLAIFSDAGANGHGIPIFSVIFLLIAAIMTITVFILSLILTIRDLQNGRQKV